MKNSTEEIEAKKYLCKVFTEAKNLQHYFDSQDLDLSQIMDCLGFYIATLITYDQIDEEDVRHLFRYIDVSKDLILELQKQDKAQD